MKIASWATPEGVAGHMWPVGHGLSTTGISNGVVHLRTAWACVVVASLAGTST